jgi:hypothetical protein
MLCIHFIQHWFNLADLACEEALYDSASLRRFVGIDLGREPVPDATTLLKFRRLLNNNQLGQVTGPCAASLRGDLGVGPVSGGCSHLHRDMETACVRRRSSAGTSRSPASKTVAKGSREAQRLRGKHAQDGTNVTRYPRLFREDPSMAPV